MAARKLAILQGKNVEPVASLIGSKNEFPCLVKANSMRMRRLLKFRVQACTGLFQNSGRSTHFSIRANRQHVVCSAAIDGHYKVAAIGRDGQVARPYTRKQKRLPIEKRQASISIVDFVGFNRAAR